MAHPPSSGYFEARSTVAYGLPPRPPPRHSWTQARATPLPFWQSGADGRMEQGRWMAAKIARGRISTSACVGGKKGVKLGQLGVNTEKKVKKV